MLRLLAPRRRRWRLHLCTTTPDQRPYLDALTAWLTRHGHTILAAPDASLAERIAAARACEICLLLLGPEYAPREPHASFSATELETYAALEGGESKLLVFALPGGEDATTVEQREFIARVRDFTAGTFQAAVTSPRLLVDELAAALARLEEAARVVDRDLTRAVMISSTGDLALERTRLRDLLTRMRHPVIDYQTAASETGTPIERVTGWASQCRALVLILGQRYGYVSPVDGLGVTELEFVTALGAGRPILALIRPDALNTEDADQRQFVERVRHFLPEERVRICPTLDDLERQAREGLRALLAERKPTKTTSIPTIPSVPEEQARAWYGRQVQRWLGMLPHARHPDGMPLADPPLLLVEKPMDIRAALNETNNHMVSFASESMAYIGATTPEDALARTPRLLIAGPPGAGKTIILRHFALQAGARLPALVSLPIYAQARRAGEAASLLEYVEREECRLLLAAPGDPSRLRAALEGGQGLLLLDDWSALDAEDREMVTADMIACANRLPPETPVIVTQRETPPTPATPPQGFTPMYVLPLMQTLQNEIIRQWLEVARAAGGLDEEQARERFEVMAFQMRSLDDITGWARTPQLLITLITVLDSLGQRSSGMLGGSGVGLLRRALRLILTLDPRPRALWEKERLLMALARQTLDAEPHLTIPNDDPKADPHETFPDALLRAAWQEASPRGGDLEDTLRDLAPLLALGPDGWAYAHAIFGVVYTVAALAERPAAARIDWVARRRLFGERSMSLALLPGELDRLALPTEGDAIVETLLAGDDAPVAGSDYSDPNHYALYAAAAAQGARAPAHARGGPGPEIARRLVALSEDEKDNAGVPEQVTWSLLLLGPAAETALDTLIAHLETWRLAYVTLRALARDGVERARVALADYETRHPPPPTRFASIAAQVAAQRARLCHDDAKERWLAAYELSAFGPFAAPAVADLIPLLGDEDEMARGCAAQALAAIGAPSAPAVSLLFQMALHDTGNGGVGFTTNAGCAAWAVGRLAMFATPEMAREAGKQLASDDTKTLDRALWTLDALGLAAAAMAPTVIEVALRRVDSISTFIVARALRSFGPDAVAQAMTALAGALQGGDQQTERWALVVVSAFKADAAPLCDLLRARIHNPEDPNRIWFFSALGDLGSAAAPALPDLRAPLDNLRQARLHAQSLTQLTPMERPPYIDTNQAQHALDALEKIGPVARPLLADVLALVDDPEYTVRSHAFDALRGMMVEVTPEIEAALLRGIADEQGTVRTSACWAAEKLRPVTSAVAAAVLRRFYTAEGLEKDKSRVRRTLDMLWDAGALPAGQYNG